MSLIIANNIKISGLATTVPENMSLEVFDDFPVVKVRRSPFEQTSSDLAFDAAKRIIAKKNIDVEEIGALIFISRTPDYRSPNTAAILQGRLGLSIDCICYDINKGSNGFQSGMITGASILNAINKRYALVLFGDTPSKFHHEHTFFSKIDSDAGSAVLLEKTEDDQLEIVSFHQSFGQYFKDFTVPKGGFRYYNPSELFDATVKENFTLVFQKENILKFLSTNLREFKEYVNNLVPKNAEHISHSQLSLLGVSPHTESSDFVIKEYGNTYSSNIPLQLEYYSKGERLSEIRSFSCIGFGEGLELSFLSFTINYSDILSTNISNDFFEDYRISHEM